MKFRDRLAGFLGYDLIKRKRNHLTAQNHLHKLFERLEINCVIDVGANFGQFAGGLRRQGYRGRIASFEPVREAFEALQARSAGDDSWVLHECALGSEDATQTIHVTRQTELASFHAPNEYAERRFTPGHPDVLEKREVPVRRLDDLFGDIVSGVDGPRVFLKLDTQGWDLQVLEGASDCLHRIVALQSEISVIPIYDGMPDYLVCLQEYRDLGFELTGLYPVTRDRDSLVVVEFDCVMQRRSLSPQAS